MNHLNTVKNGHHDIPEPEVMSSDVFFRPSQQKNKNQGNQQYLKCKNIIAWQIITELVK